MENQEVKSEEVVEAKEEVKAAGMSEKQVTKAKEYLAGLSMRALDGQAKGENKEYVALVKAEIGKRKK